MAPPDTPHARARLGLAGGGVRAPSVARTVSIWCWPERVNGNETAGLRD
jgi:hypothetical protein